MLTAGQICTEVYELSGFGAATAYQNGDIDDKLIFALLKRVARDVAKYRWQELVKTGRITINTKTGKNVYTLPTDFREFIPGSMRTLEDSRQVDFPTDFETWAQIDSNVGITGVQHRLRLQGNYLHVLPSDGGSYTIRFEYISNHPVKAEALPPATPLPGEIDPGGVEFVSNTLLTFSKDNDIWLLDDDLIIKALKMKWSVEKGLETVQADMADYQAYVHDLKGTQASSKRIRMGASSPYFPQAPYTNLWK